ncbi:MAG TPA: alginate export family protein, partial [Candidatus Glassbacteria bacterium]|nr:alginate export family protein [Candidatus Glassbacteria bacterium]
MFYRICLGLTLLNLNLCPWSLVAAADEPWRLSNAAGLPDALSLTGQHRMRYETLDGQFRNGRRGGDQALMFRTSLLAELALDRVKIVVEGLDSRALWADAGTPLGNTDVNPLDLLQAYVEMPVNDLIISGSQGILRGGRMTLDLGSRRLVARNSFRNTINAFTGVDWQWTGPTQNRFRAFYTLPVQRLVDGNPLDNEPELDRQYSDVRFWGLNYAPARLPWGDPGEIFLLGLHEDDRSSLATSNRELQTVGVRFYRQPAAGRFDYQIESDFQFGESRASTATSDVTDLDHFAHFQHGEAGYTFESPWSPQLLLQYDYASGDDQGNDGENNRFDTLFGARRFDFGPTS